MRIKFSYDIGSVVFIPEITEGKRLSGVQFVNKSRGLKEEMPAGGELIGNYGCNSFAACFECEGGGAVLL
jgi:hypothetical protein